VEVELSGTDTQGKGAGGYSATPLAKKIGIRPGHRVSLLHAPDPFPLPGLPDDVDITRYGGGRTASQEAEADVTVAFYRAHADLAAEAPALVTALADHAMLWIAWPRKAAGHVSDIAENDLRDLFLPLGVVDVKVAALGEDWSGLKFVRRKENRGATPAGNPGRQA